MAGKTSARPMTGGMAIVEALIANKVDRVFGLPGAQLYALFDALAQRSDVIATIGARHGQAEAAELMLGERRLEFQRDVQRLLFRDDRALEGEHRGVRLADLGENRPTGCGVPVNGVARDVAARCGRRIHRPAYA